MVRRFDCDRQRRQRWNVPQTTIQLDSWFLDDLSERVRKLSGKGKIRPQWTFLIK